MKRTIRLTAILALVLSLWTLPALAKPDWPSDTGVQSEAGIVVDMDSGTVLFGQNIHVQEIPASITKILTALVVIENSDLEDAVTFSYDAVYNVEEGSGNKLQIEEGDVLTVRECLYLMLLQSSNQAANALAEHVGGSRDGFVDMMNAKAAELGCTESHFANPSGLNDDTQRTTAYDMSIIARAAYRNPTLLEINSATEAQLPPTANRPNGTTYYMEHKLLVTDDPSSETYYPDAIAGKTGYTSQAGQTLVTYARRGDRGQITVTLKSTDKTHYSDTITLMEFGFNHFYNLNISENETEYVTGSDAVELGGVSYMPSELYYDSSAVLTLPNDSVFADAEKSLVTDLPENSPENAVALMRYTYNERQIGQAFLLTAREESPETEGTATPAAADSQGNQTPPQGGEGMLSALSGNIFLIGGTIVLAAIIVGILLIWRGIQEKKERERMRIRREKRRQRLADIGCSEEEFARLLEERRKKHDQ